MALYVIRRLLFTVASLWLIVTVVFVAVRLTGDAAALLVPPDATAEDRARVERNLGLDKSIPEQYGAFLQSLARGDLGRSYRWHDPALTVVTERLPATIKLAAAAAVVATVGGILLGILSALTKGTWVDLIARVGSVIGQAIPDFWAGIMLILVFGVWLGWLPVFGSNSWKHLVLPTIALSGYTLASQMRLTRSSMLDVLDTDYIRMARLKGLREPRVVVIHALRNAAIPIVTLTGIRLGRLLSGAIVIEVVFAWPGLGRTMVEAILNRDFPVVQAGVLVIAAIFVTVNFLVDMSYALLDPRVRG